MFFLPNLKGIGGRFRFINWKPSWIGFTACPLGNVLGPIENKGSVARDDAASRLRFPLKPSASSRGRTTRRFFVVCRTLPVWGRAPRPSKPSAARQLPVIINSDSHISANHRLPPLLSSLPHKSVKHSRRFKSNTLIKRNRPVIRFRHRQRDEAESPPAEIPG